MKRFPRLKYELIDCGIVGHELLGTDAQKIRAKDHVFVREHDGLRWYRCLRCDSWIPQPLPKNASDEFPPEQKDVTVPLRGKPLRDKYVLRLIAIDRAFHAVVLSLLAFVIFLFASHQSGLQQYYQTLMDAYQAVNGGVSQTGELSKLKGLFTLSSTHVYELGFFVAAYAALEAIEMVGLWMAKRWAEYLTFSATLIFIPYEIYEIAHKPTVIKIGAFAINIGIAIYLLYAKRLFGIRGGGAAEQREREHDSGWKAVKRATPKS